MNVKKASLPFSFCLLQLCSTPALFSQDDPYAAFLPKTGPLLPEEERSKLQVPPGFEVALVASDPDIKKPMNIAFDDRGRLWLTETVEYPFPAKEGAEARDGVKILEDTDGDGRADKITKFASGLNIPIGILPIQGGVIVYGIPRIYKLLDHDGDDHVDEKIELYGPFGFGDTHGMVNSFTWGFDGWVYACHGYSNSSEVRGQDGSKIQMQSGNVWRWRIDGSRVEQFTHGQVNPFGLCFDPLGNLYSADCHSQPVYMLLRNGWYPSFGKPHDGLGFAPDMVDHDHGSTAICGIVYYSAGQFPPEYRDTVFTGNVVTCRVNHDRLEKRGSTLWTIHQPDFVNSADPWFRPVDLKVGPDGAIYISDFYNKVIGHYEVPLTHPGRDRERGRIWRISYREPGNRGSGTEKEANRPPSSFLALGRLGPKADPKALLPELIKDLESPTPCVRTAATNQLVERLGKEAIGPLLLTFEGASSSSARSHALWAMERLGALEDALLERAARHADRATRVHALKILAERNTLSERERQLAIQALKDPDAFARRAAAEALGLHPRPENLPPLLELRRGVPAEDTHLTYVARKALRDQLLTPEAWDFATALARKPDRPEGQMDDRALLANVAPGVPLPASAIFLLDYLRSRSVARDELVNSIHHLARYLPAETRDSLLAEVVRSQGQAGLDQELSAFQALIQGTEERGHPFPAWVKSLGNDLAGKLIALDDDGKASEGMRIVRTLKLGEWRQRLEETVLSKSRSEERRKAACETLVALDPAGQVVLLGRLLGDPEEPFSLREISANMLGDIDQSPALEELALQLRSVPERLGYKVAAALARRSPGCERLLSEVEGGKASARLLQDRAVQVRLSRSKLDGLEDRLKKLTEGLPTADEKIGKLISERQGGYLKASKDLAQGAQVFEKTCAPCHRLAGKGNKVGPELDGIGRRGLERILEDVLDSNRNVDQAFRTTVLIQTDGLLRTGLLVSEEGASLTLVDTQGKPFTVSKGEIKERSVSNLSPMPSNIAETLPEADFHNLMGFLLSQVQKDEKTEKK
jgi:putative heme-binding domain-containing protein